MVMKFTKVEEQKGEYLWVYFTDSQQRKQGELLCYKTEGKLPSQENLLFVEQYENDILLNKKWMKLPVLLS
jgi:hypothetical protein